MQCHVRDARFQTWAESFVRHLQADPARYGTSQAEADFLGSLLDKYTRALLASSSEATRTRGTIAAKQDARSALEWLCRRFARQIKENLGITDGDKLNLGIRPLNVARTPISCPQSNPLMSIVGAMNTCHILRYKDSAGDGPAKPYGASELQLFAAITDRKHAPQEEARFIGKFTRNPILMKFTPQQDGLVATYYARWASERGETGPFSIPISMRIAA